MLYRQNNHHHLTKLLWSVTDKGLSSRMVSTACGPDPLFRADDSQQKHSTSSRFAILAKSGLFLSVYYCSNLCLDHAKILAIDAWKSRQKILRKSEVHCSEKSTRHSQTSGQTIDVTNFTASAVHAQLNVRYVSVWSWYWTRPQQKEPSGQVLWISLQKNKTSGVVLQTWRVH